MALDLWLGIVALDEYLYSAPLNADSILELHPPSGDIRKIAVDHVYRGEHKWRDPVVCNGVVFFMPLRAPCLLEFNPQSQTVRGHGGFNPLPAEEDDGGEDWGVAVVGTRIFFTRSIQIVEYETASGVFKFIDTSGVSAYIQTGTHTLACTNIVTTQGPAGESKVLFNFSAANKDAGTLFEMDPNLNPNSDSLRPIRGQEYHPVKFSVVAMAGKVFFRQRGGNNELLELDPFADSVKELKVHLSPGDFQLGVQNANELALFNSNGSIVTFVNPTSCSVRQCAIPVKSQCADGACTAHGRMFVQYLDKGFICMLDCSGDVADVIAEFSIEAAVVEQKAAERRACHAEERAAPMQEMRRQLAAELYEARRQAGWIMLSRKTLASHAAGVVVRPLRDLDPRRLVLTELVHRGSSHQTRCFDTPRLEVLNVELVENPISQRLYQASAERLRCQCQGHCREIAALSHLLVPQGDSHLNELFLFRGAGTCASMVRAVCLQGFTPRCGGSLAGNVSQGTSFATSVNQADIQGQRGEALGQRPVEGAVRFLIVARVLLGEAFKATSPTDHAWCPPLGSNGRPFDSVWADGRGSGGITDDAEVTIYNHTHAIPVAVITYEHATGCGCATCRELLE